MIPADQKKKADIANKTEQARKTRRAQTIAFLVLVAAVVALKVAFEVSSYLGGKALNSPGENTSAFTFFAAAWVSGFTIFVFGLGVTAVWWQQQRIFSRVHFFGALVIIPILFMRHNFYIDGVRAALGPIDDAAYVSLAQKTRALFGAEKTGGISLRDFRNHAPMTPEENARAAAFSVLLASSVLAHWPQDNSYVGVEDNGVFIIRGGGLGGRIGVQIFDQPSIDEDHSTLLEPPEGAYLPTAMGLSKRVVLISGD